MMLRAQYEPDPAPPVIPGCERVRRFWDRQNRRWSARIAPGEIFVTRHDEVISAVIGSGIAVCVRDPVLRIGGMRLFMLPSNPAGVAAGYADGAMDGDGLAEFLPGAQLELETLIGEVLKLGASRDRLKAKLFGVGRNIFADDDAGAKSFTQMRKFLRERGMPVVAEKIGDSHPRLIVYSPNSGMIQVKRLPDRPPLG